MIIFAWDGFPQYAARCVGALVKASKEEIVVIATRPNVPIEGMEKVCNCPVTWVDGADRITEKCPDIISRIDSRTLLVVSGWYVPVFNQLSDIVRSRKGTLACINDANYLRSFKTVLRAIQFRLLRNRKYDKFFVPGKSGRRLLNFYGVSDKRIAEGLYSADESLFHDGLPLQKREKKIIYVGQFIERKNVRRLVEAFEKVFEKVKAEGEGEDEVKVRGEGEQRWELHLYGSGPLRDELSRMIKQSNNPASIHLHDFCQPEELAAKYREARVFCLPSLEEHWGLVVHEAALSGCVLCLSDRVGAAEDLFDGRNGARFDPYDTDSLVQAFARIFRMTDEELARAHDTSLRLAATIGLKTFADGVRNLAGREI